MTTVAGDVSRLSVLILAWLLTKPDGGTRSELDRALKPILGQRWSIGEQRRVIDEAVESLERTGLTTRVRKSALKLSESGRRAGCGALKVEGLPEEIGWKTLKRYLLTPALGISLPCDADKVRAAAIARRYQPTIGASPTMPQAIDAVVWSELGVEPRKRLTLKAVREVLLNRALGTTKPLDLKTAFVQLAAKAVGARRTSANELQIAAIGLWLKGSEIAPTAKAQGDAASMPSVVEPLNDDAFAARVLEAARTSKTGRFGDDKVFISHVLRKLAQEGTVEDDSDAFKARLIAAHRRGLLSLSRADLVEAMDPKDVEASEARYLRATFHFVRI
jgi:hypothetical protein